MNYILTSLMAELSVDGHIGQGILPEKCMARGLFGAKRVGRGLFVAKRVGRRLFVAKYFK